MPAARTEVVLTFDNLGEAADENAACPGPRRIRRSRWCCRGCSSCCAPRAPCHLLRRGGQRASATPRRWPRSSTAATNSAATGGATRCRAAAPERAARDPRPIARRAAGTGVAVDGFRPPGGTITRYDLALLAARGIRWCSPTGSAPGIDRDVVCLPFAWPLIDAYYLSTALAPLRTAEACPRAAAGGALPGSDRRRARPRRRA